MPPHSVVVGGTRGHGRAWVRLLCAKGHAVSVLGRRGPSPQDKRLPKCRFIEVDLSRVETISRACDDLLARGPLDTLAFFQRSRGAAGDPWDAELAVSLSATNALIKRLHEHFARDGARSIVVVGGSAASLVAREQPVGYHVAKAGLRQLVRYYAATLGKDGLRVNMVSPGAAVKEESKRFYDEHRRLRLLNEKFTPLGRMGTSKDIAGVIDFLCSPKASFITGNNIVVDGGLSLLWQETLAREASPSAGTRVTRRH